MLIERTLFPRFSQTRATRICRQLYNRERKQKRNKYRVAAARDEQFSGGYAGRKSSLRA